MTMATETAIDDVRTCLPDVLIRYQGRTYYATVRGRLNTVATVTPYRLADRADTRPHVYHPGIEFSWSAVSTESRSGGVLQT